MLYGIPIASTIILIPPLSRWQGPDTRRNETLFQPPPTTFGTDSIPIDVPNLLVTDDDTAFREVISEAFVRKGFAVTQASDGDEAIDVIQARSIHLVLVDVHMPRVSGLEVMRQLATNPASPPCVLMSAELTESIEQEAARMNAYRVLSKPVRLKALTEIVCHALKDRYGWQRSS